MRIGVFVTAESRDGTRRSKQRRAACRYVTEQEKRIKYKPYILCVLQ